MTGLPAGPMVWTVIAIGLINALVAYGLAHLVAPARAPVVSAPVVVIGAVAAVLALVLCIHSWRSHSRRRRMYSER